ncbi:hypothetical protein V7124_04730 [Neobacillus niacini]|uniref:hypothetical protein n=1 Tax=Neobacillus niacini TaxID=86668 RepID=UPI002FFE90F9
MALELLVREDSNHERMYYYFSQLYNKYRKPILPIAIFSYDQKRNEQNQYTRKKKKFQ